MKSFGGDNISRWRRKIGGLKSLWFMKCSGVAMIDDRDGGRMMERHRVVGVVAV